MARKRYSHVTIDSGELPSARGVAEGYPLSQIISRWQSVAHGSFREDCRALKQMIEETDELRLWEKNVGGFTFANRDEFLRKQVLIDYELTEHDMTEIVAMLKRGEPDGARQKLADKMKAAKPLADGPGRKIGSNDKHANIGTQGPTNPYLAARIKRDAPEIAAAVERGEYKTMRAAAIAAGIVKPPTALAGLRRFWKKASPSEREAFLKEIDHDERPRMDRME